MTEPRMTESQDAARARYGGVKIGSAFFGFLTAVGMTVLLPALLAAAGYGLGAATGTGSDEALDRAQQETGASAGELGIVGIVVVLVVVFLAYFSGGYVAGRMARFNGLRQGLAVWGWAVLVTVGLAVLATVTDSDIELPSGGVDTFGIGLVEIVVLAGLTLAGALLGGLAGMRFHRRVDRAELTAPVDR